MRSYLLAVMAVLASSLCEPPGAVAQIMAAGGQTQGAFGYRVMGQPLGTGTQGRFGNRVLGQPFQPPPTSMGNWVPYAASGNFMNYGTPYGSVSITGQPFLPQPVVSIGLAGVAPMPQYNLANPAEVPAPVTPPPAPETTAPEPLPETNGGAEGIAPAEPAATMAPAAGRTITTVTASLSRLGGALANAGPFARSAELSDRLTRIARAKGMLAGAALNVYLGNHVALLQGEVRSPGDRTLLANVIGLEPEVQQIDNQLVAAGSGDVSVRSSNRLSR